MNNNPVVRLVGGPRNGLWQIPVDRIHTLDFPDGEGNDDRYERESPLVFRYAGKYSRERRNDGII